MGQQYGTQERSWRGDFHYGPSRERVPDDGDDENQHVAFQGHQLVSRQARDSDSSLHGLAAEEEPRIKEFKKYTVVIAGH